MKFLVRFDIPETEKEVRTAYIEPKSEVAVEQLKKWTDQKYVRVQGEGKENLLVQVIEALYKLHALFAKNSMQAKVLEKDFMDIADAYTHDTIIEEWSHSDNEEHKEIATKIKIEAYRRKAKILEQVGILRKDRQV